MPNPASQQSPEPLWKEKWPGTHFTDTGLYNMTACLICKQVYFKITRPEAQVHYNRKHRAPAPPSPPASPWRPC